MKKYNGNSMVLGNPHDPFFKYDLVYAADYHGHLLWFYNIRHLRYVKAFIQAKLRKAVKDLRIRAEGQGVPVTMSFGLASFQGTITLEEAIRQADQALYAAKNGGRNRCEVFAGETLDAGPQPS